MGENVNKLSKIKSENVEVSDEEEEMDESKRKSRNLSEKKRRDQFNMLINELNSIISINGRKMDKSTILKATMNTLRVYNENVARSREYEINEEWKPSFLTNEEYTYLMLETLGGFIIVFSSCGKILFVSSNLAVSLGYNLDEMLNLNIFDLVPENDRSYLENMFFISTVNNFYPQNEENPLHFKCHISRRPGNLGDNFYEPVEFLGQIKPQEIQNLPPKEEKISEMNKPLIFVGLIRLLTPQLYNDVSLHDHLKTEFISHHNFEWKFLFLDERASPIIGYSPFEVLGTSGYDYYHVDDLENVINYHKSLMVQDEGISGYYRFLTKGHQWIWLQTESYITRRQWNSRIEFVVCTHRVVNPLNTKGAEGADVRIMDGNSSFSSNGSTSCSNKTSPPSWQSTTSNSNYCEEEDKDDRLTQLCEDYLSQDNSSSNSFSQNLHHHKKRKFSKKIHQFHKSYGDYAGNWSDTSSSNSTGFQLNNNSSPLIKESQLSAKSENNLGVENMKGNFSIEDCLQKKYEQLQQIIAERQEELREVSEQLFLARSKTAQQNSIDVNNDLTVLHQLSRSIAVDQSNNSEIGNEYYRYETN